MFAETLKCLVQLNPGYCVVWIADDRVSADAAIAECRPDLALVNLQLAHRNTGFA